MEFKTFQDGRFGKLTTITNPTTGITMFIAQEVADLWGHSNVTQAIKDAKLADDEKKIVKKKTHYQFFTELTKQHLVGRRSSSVTLVTESGLWKLALESELKGADELKDWLSRDVLPALRKTGKFILQEEFKNIGEHSKIEVQKQNSKDVNSINYKNGGVQKIVEYNTESCFLHTGMKPKQVRELGKQFGLKSIDCSSAKQVIRTLKPAIACGMSFTDNLVKKGYQLDMIAGISKKLAVPLFDELLKIGVRPAELDY